MVEKEESTHSVVGKIDKNLIVEQRLNDSNHLTLDSF